jgi:hypothetical protein
MVARSTRSNQRPDTNGFEVAFAACIKEMGLQPEDTGGLLEPPPLGFAADGIGRIDKQGDARCRGHKLVQQFDLRLSPTFSTGGLNRRFWGVAEARKRVGSKGRVLESSVV